MNEVDDLIKTMEKLNKIQPKKFTYSFTKSEHDALVRAQNLGLITGLVPYKSLNGFKIISVGGNYERTLK